MSVSCSKFLGASPGVASPLIFIASRLIQHISAWPFGFGEEETRRLAFEAGRIANTLANQSKVEAGDGLVEIAIGKLGREKPGLKQSRVAVQPKQKKNR